MSAIPTRRLLVYAVAGVLVLVVGTVGLLALRSPARMGQTDAMVLDVSGLDVDEVAGADSPETTGPSLAPTSTSVTEAAIFVQVAGAVRRPGVYQVAPQARVFQAVLQAGGFTETADQEAVPLAARLTDGCRLYVPERGETGAGQVLSTDPLAGTMSEHSPRPVSLNSATLEELDALPGIGPALARQIVTYRESQGRFTSVDQLTEVPGIGPSKLEQLRPLVGL
jgi:competence protein ComEA